jgi:hypothetical protein
MKLVSAPLCVSAVIVISAVALAGCGGGSDSSSASAKPGVGAAFAAKALAVCNAALTDKKAWKPFPVSNFNPTDPDPTAFPQVANWLDQEVTPTFDTWHTKLVALGNPASAQQSWNDLLDAVAKIEQGNKDQVDAARAGDTNAFKAATQSLQDAQPKLIDAANAAGVAACADVHAS